MECFRIYTLTTSTLTVDVLSVSHSSKSQTGIRCIRCKSSFIAIMFEAVDDNWQYLKDALRLQNKHLTSFLNQVAEISSKRWCCLFSNVKRTRWRAFSEAEHSTHHFLVNYSALLCWHSQQERLDALALPSIGIIFMAKFCQRIQQLQSSSFSMKISYGAENVFVWLRFYWETLQSWL